MFVILVSLAVVCQYGILCAYCVDHGQQHTLAVNDIQYDNMRNIIKDLEPNLFEQSCESSIN